MTNFSLLITDWYRQNKRNLPWRQTIDPYEIWISEIILQQTKVDQGLSYYLRFIETFPTVESLSTANENDVLRLWQGLGYYSRARNLHQTAQIIHKERNGEFPKSYVELMQLKGIGPYTAAAIASFCFKEVVPVVDGNVYRVLSRYFGIDEPIDTHGSKKLFFDLANEVIDAKQPDTFNQAIMEFGALQCVPKNPNCTVCPLQYSCDSLASDSVSVRPAKSKKNKVSNRYFHFLHFDDGNKIILEKRSEKDIWQNLFQFPLVETDQENDVPNLQPFITEKSAELSTKISHLLSHQKIHATFHHFNQLPEKINPNWMVIDWKNLDDYPLPQLIVKYLTGKK